MQKISAYYIPNRIELVADISGFFVEYNYMYRRNVKIYQGVDNIIEFDIKNADQKRIDLSQFSSLKLVLMDSTNHEIGYGFDIIPDLSKRGIGILTIYANDLCCLEEQYLKYAITGIKNNKEVILYANTNFDSVGTIFLSSEMMPKSNPVKIYDSFTQEIDVNNIVTFHSSSIPVKLYEAIPTEKLSFDITVTGFIGSIWLEATKQGTISSEAYKKAGKPWGSWTQDYDSGMFTGIIPYGSDIDITEYQYLRVSYQTQSINGMGASFIVTKSGDSYSVSIRSGGSGYGLGSQIKVLGSQLGGTNGVNDLFITVTGLNSGGTSAYMISSITNISWSGTPDSGSGTFMVSGTNYSGTVNQIVVH